MTDTLTSSLHRAAKLLRSADGLLITAGAGMGIDSGLPDFRGNEGFWNAYPALGQRGLKFTEIASGAGFNEHPQLSWGFYGHRLKLYRETMPHAGFAILQELAAALPHGAFVFTSNVDGQFQKAGFPASQVKECHGSIHYLQCSANCNNRIWPAEGFDPQVDEGQCLLRSPLPRCPDCAQVARPNILMFNDWNWNSAQTDMQTELLRMWLRRVESLVILELGAGTVLPTVRRFGEAQEAPLIRINPREDQISKPGDVGIALGALAGLQAIRQAMHL
jgi:NAD-dependent SIR2 family protein deacetylase